MAKPASKETWQEVRRLFECGESLTRINDTTGVDKASISKRAKKEGWEKGKLQPLISDSVRIKYELSTLDVETRATVESIVESKTKAIIRYNSYQDRLANIAIEMIEEKKELGELSMMELSSASKVVKDSREGVVGKAPDTALQVNIGQQVKEIRRTIVYPEHITPR